jgi:FkbM family methyltransferase
VIAFEPVDHVADKLQAHIERNRLAQATLVRAGLSDHRGSAFIYDTWRPRQSGDENRGLGSLYGGGPGRQPIQNIDITTLDHFLSTHPEPRVDLIKIDVEGSELPCLRGAKATLESFRPMLIVEIQEQSALAGGYRQEDILEFVAGLGYSVHLIGRGGTLSPLRIGELADHQNIFCQPPGQC